ncbi:hypothetical protein [Lactonifactor sp. BIOML-A7]|jgi:hypothetical protein|uniref:hypothetical protein n=1 Tax=Lactonifactor sp. BIOML-A7 TaxID=2584660 RepID=UPI0015635E12|nr:hypothetical protein [Lactonifactor sp. BIOML-A7]
MYIKLATGLGSIPSIATIIGLLFNSIVSGLIYDTFKFVLMEGTDTMKEILFLGLGGCGDIV